MTKAVRTGRVAQKCLGSRSRAEQEESKASSLGVVQGALNSRAAETSWNCPQLPLNHLPFPILMGQRRGRLKTPPAVKLSFGSMS